MWEPLSADLEMLELPDRCFSRTGGKVEDGGRVLLPESSKGSAVY